MIHSKHYYDSTSNWTDGGIWKPPPFDVEGYQKKLNDVCGLSASGQPVVRVQWAWDCRRWMNTAWDSFGNATQGEWRQKYRALTVEIGNDEYVDISPPRWILEERFEPGQYERSWEASRYVLKVNDTPPHECKYCGKEDWIHSEMSEGENVVCIFCRETTVLLAVKRDIWGQAPREGWYNLLPSIGIVADHDAFCCKQAAKTQEICYGKYKVPGQKELDILKRVIWRRNQNKEANPHAELSQADLEAARAWGLETDKEIRIKDRQELKDKWKDEVLVHGVRVVPEVAIQALKDAGRRTPINFTRIS